MYPVNYHEGDAVLFGKNVGIIRYIGKLYSYSHNEKYRSETEDQLYIGIECNEAITNGHNGTLDNVKYFSTANNINTGLMLKPSQISKRLTPSDLLRTIKKQFDHASSLEQTIVELRKEKQSLLEFTKLLKNKMQLLENQSLFRQYALFNASIKSATSVRSATNTNNSSPNYSIPNPRHLDCNIKERRHVRDASRQLEQLNSSLNVMNNATSDLMSPMYQQQQHAVPNLHLQKDSSYNTDPSRLAGVSSWRSSEYMQLSGPMRYVHFLRSLQIRPQTLPPYCGGMLLQPPEVMATTANQKLQRQNKVEKTSLNDSVDGSGSVDNTSMRSDQDSFDYDSQHVEESQSVSSRGVAEKPGNRKLLLHPHCSSSKSNRTSRQNSVNSIGSIGSLRSLESQDSVEIAAAGARSSSSTSPSVDYAYEYEVDTMFTGSNLPSLLRGMQAKILLHPKSKIKRFVVVSARYAKKVERRFQQNNIMFIKRNMNQPPKQKPELQAIISGETRSPKKKTRNEHLSIPVCDDADYDLNLEMYPRNARPNAEIGTVGSSTPESGAWVLTGSTDYSAWLDSEHVSDGV